MLLSALISDAAEAYADLRVTGFAIDHRKVAGGTIFGAFRGAKFNGEDFIADAIELAAFFTRVGLTCDFLHNVESIGHLAED